MLGVWYNVCMLFQVPISGKEYQGMQGVVLLAEDCVETNG